MENDMLSIHDDLVSLRVIDIGPYSELAFNFLFICDRCCVYLILLLGRHTESEQANIYTSMCDIVFWLVLLM